MGTTSTAMKTPSTARRNRSLRLFYPILPPSENDIRQVRWIRVKGKPQSAGITYTTEAEGYKREFREYVRTHYMVEIMKFRKEHRLGNVYSLRLVFHFEPEQVLNTTWVSGKKKPQSPYKKMDVGNRRKLLEDAFAESIDIDDSLNFSMEQYKVVDGKVGVDIILEEEDPNLFGIPEEYFSGT